MTDKHASLVSRISELLTPGAAGRAKSTVQNLNDAPHGNLFTRYGERLSGSRAVGATGLGGLGINALANQPAPVSPYAEYA